MSVVVETSIWWNSLGSEKIAGLAFLPIGTKKKNPNGNNKVEKGKGE